MPRRPGETFRLGCADALHDQVQMGLAKWVLQSVVQDHRRHSPVSSELPLQHRRHCQILHAVIIEILRAAANFEDDELAREYIVSFDVTDQLSDKAIDGLVAARHSFATGAADPFVSEPDPQDIQAAFAGRLKKKH